MATSIVNCNYRFGFLNQCFYAFSIPLLSISISLSPLFLSPPSFSLFQSRGLHTYTTSSGNSIAFCLSVYTICHLIRRLACELLTSPWLLPKPDFCSLANHIIAFNVSSLFLFLPNPFKDTLKTRCMNAIYFFIECCWLRLWWYL